jgi:hypothetical protein
MRGDVVEKLIREFVKGVRQQVTIIVYGEYARMHTKMAKFCEDVAHDASVSNVTTITWTTLTRTMWTYYITAARAYVTVLRRVHERSSAAGIVLVKDLKAQEAQDDTVYPNSESQDKAAKNLHSLEMQ